MFKEVPKSFSSPEEEIAYLREKIAESEREFLERVPNADNEEIETVGKQELKEYISFTPKSVLDKGFQMKEEEMVFEVEKIMVETDPVQEILDLAKEKGIRNALLVLEKIKNPFLIDKTHRKLVEMIKSGVLVQAVKEGGEIISLLNMTLYEVVFPEVKNNNGQDNSLASLVGTTKQLLAGLKAINQNHPLNHIAIEIAVADFSDDIIFYIAVPDDFTSLFEKHLLSLFPTAQLTIQVHDYNIFVDNGSSIVSEVSLKKHPLYPVRMVEEFISDPLLVVLNAFSKIDREGGGAAIQFIVRFPQKSYNKEYQEISKNIQKGMKESEAISRSTASGKIMYSLYDVFAPKKDEVPEIDQEKIQLFASKTKDEIIETNIRIAASSISLDRANQFVTEIESSLSQFSLVSGNSFVFKRVSSGATLKDLVKSFAFREFSKKKNLPLSVSEFSTLIHLPSNGVLSSPQFRQASSSTAPAPNDMPKEGTVLGINRHRNTERTIYMTELDRMRHLYVIGQTGTGKSKFLTNLILQDIQQGNGVCMIDPHGTDIEDVLGAIPKEREQDVIYFDPSRMDRVMGLNMLEYDVSKPEQKTFVVNELFSIFKKLYGANPESMGPMFEQYFRNATMLVMEDPASGNTLMDIARVMADSDYRRYKLSKAKNPVVLQFWQEIATKAGGDASLENIIPYIVSKFDVFTANDYMRPIIGQQKSAFNFRKLMDERKILLINLSKGRLGEINANLIGMIFVGKILMAALSRVDDPTKGFPPFYLHIDEFQNVSTPAISSILSEARKYKLSLTMAHQFIAQLDPDIKDAVFGNVGSMATFRIGSDDAQFLENQLSPVFTAKDIMNIPNFNAFVKILSNGVPVKPFSIAALPPIKPDPSRVEGIIMKSLMTFGRSREEVEAEISRRYSK